MKGDELEEGGGGRTGRKCKGVIWWAGVRSKMGNRDGASKNLRYEAEEGTRNGYHEAVLKRARFGRGLFDSGSRSCYKDGPSRPGG